MICNYNDENERPAKSNPSRSDLIESVIFQSKITLKGKLKQMYNVANCKAYT